MAAFLGACGGGTGSAPPPPSAPKAALSPPPAAVNRTAIGSARLVLRLPAAIRAAKATNRPSTSARRAPNYVNPIANAGTYAGNVLDIYVDGSLVANIDGSVDANHSIVVKNSSDGTQSITLPLYSTAGNQIVAIEWDPNISQLLAIGEANNGGFAAGSIVDVTLTMQMNAQYIGVIDVPAQSSPALMLAQTYTALPCLSTVSLNAFALYSADGSGTLVPIAGYSGTSMPVLSAVTPDAGTTRIAQSLIGNYFVSWDSSCNGVTLAATTANPAYAIYLDINQNYLNYYNAVFVNNNTFGPNQGIWRLMYLGQLHTALFGNPTASGSIHVASGSGLVTEYSTGISGGSQPNLIALGPDGNVWFTEFAGNRIGRITPSGVVTEFSAGITAGAQVQDIISGPDGNLWFTEYSGNRIGQITPSGAVTEFSAGITTGSQPNGIASGPDGNLWFTEHGIDRIARITPSGVVTEFYSGITAGSQLSDIVNGPDGNLWFCEPALDRVGSITPSGAVTEFSAGITAGSQPVHMVSGPDGNIWFVEFLGNRVGRITPSGVVNEFSAGITAGAQLEDIAVGSDGNLWFTETVANRIGRITPSGVVTEFPNIAGPVGIVSGPDRKLWFAEYGASKIGKIAP